MSLRTFIDHLFGIDTAKSAAAVSNASASTVATVQSFAKSEGLKVVAALKETDIGTAVANDISAIQSHNLTGAEKFSTVLGNTIPLVIKFLDGGGVAALEADVEGIARSLVQSIYVDIADTGFGKIAGEFAHLLGI